MKKSLRTYLKHTSKDFYNRSVNPPIVRASTIIFKTMKDLRELQKKKIKNPRGGHYEYGRQGTSTVHELEKILTNLEECYHVFLTSSGFGSVFLAVNLFCGCWILKDSQKFNISKYIVFLPLVVTYFVGPLGMFIYWLIRIISAKRFNLID